MNGRTLPYKVLSVLIALALWFIVRDERVEETISVTLELSTSPELVVSNEGVQELSVGVTGTRAALDRLRRGDQVHAVRLKASEPGLVLVRVKPEDIELPPGVEVFRVTPSQTSVRLETRTTKRVPVRPRLVIEEGTGFRVRKVVTVPERVRVGGPASVVGGLDEVWTEAIPVEPRGERFSGQFPISLPHGQLKLEEPGPVTVVIEFEEVTTAGPEPVIEKLSDPGKPGGTQGAAGGGSPSTSARAR